MSRETAFYKRLRLSPSRLHANGLFASEPIRKGERILKFGGLITNERTRYSLQIGEASHLGQSEDIDDHLNHSCDPNCRIDFESLELIAIRDIQEGEELTYNYCTAEEVLRFPFDCRCGSVDCVGRVQGFRFMTGSQKKRILPFASPYLQSRKSEG